MAENPASYNSAACGGCLPIHHWISSVDGAASLIHLDSGEKMGDETWSVVRAVGTQHKEGSYDIKGLLWVPMETTQ